MNKPVSLELKQLLYNKGWRYELSDDISETGSLYNNHSLAEERFNQNDVNYVDITIADIIMWLYDKHGIWISCHIRYDSLFWCQIFIKDSYSRWNAEHGIHDFNTSEFAYTEAIKYCLNNKI